VALPLADWNLIRSARLFASLEEEDLRAIVASPRIEQLAEGRTLFLQGTPANAFFIMLDGWVVLTRRQADGERAVVKLVGPGESFAEALIVQGARYPVSAEAATQARLLRIDTAAIRTLVVSNPRIALAIVAACHKQLHELIEQVEHIKTWSARRRLACFILNAVSVKEGPATVTLPVDRALIAARLGMTPSTLSRTLAALEPLGIVVHGREVTVADVAGLSSFVDKLE
jgi:CRP-like cAMP-binding protein